MQCRPTKIVQHHVIHDQVGAEKGQIEGVVVKVLKSWPDDRGHFTEIFRDYEDVAADFEIKQTSLTMTRANTIKAFHYHEKQDDIFVPMVGTARISLVDFRSDSPTYGVANSIFCGELYLKAVRIPKGVAHGYEVLPGQDLVMVYYTNQVYDPKDEFRSAYDDPEIGWAWWGIEHR